MWSLTAILSIFLIATMAQLTSTASDNKLELDVKNDNKTSEIPKTFLERCKLSTKTINEVCQIGQIYNCENINEDALCPNGYVRHRENCVVPDCKRNLEEDITRQLEREMTRVLILEKRISILNNITGQTDEMFKTIQESLIVEITENLED
uniref:Uncharacterized protein n=1 Tax=Acrobeloides nanus TaxID=290746 RepID=A0A914E225_9BILA